MRQPKLRFGSVIRTHPPPQGLELPDETASWKLSEKFGEPVGIRTRDLLIKSQLLYRLSYRPTQGVH